MPDTRIDVSWWIDYQKAHDINAALDRIKLAPVPEILAALDDLWENGAGYGYSEGEV